MICGGGSSFVMGFAMYGGGVDGRLLGGVEDKFPGESLGFWMLNTGMECWEGIRTGSLRGWAGKMVWQKCVSGILVDYFNVIANFWQWAFLFVLCGKFELTEIFESEILAGFLSLEGFHLIFD